MEPPEADRQPAGVRAPSSIGLRLWYHLWRQADGWHARGRLARSTSRVLVQRLHAWLNRTP